MYIMLIKDVIAFIYRPTPFDASQVKFINQIYRRLLMLSVSAAFLSLVIWSIITLASCYNIFPKFVEIDPDSHRGPVFDAFITVLIAPIMEEFLFRWPLRFFKSPVTCKFAVWVSCVIFALVHLGNFVRFDGAYPLMLILVLPQLFAGILFAFARMKWGFWYGFLCHGIHNAICICAMMYLAIHC